MADDLTCERCGRRFAIPASVRGRYPGWKPRVCMRCRGRERDAERAAASNGGAPLATAQSSSPEVLGEAPSSAFAIYTDGSCRGNPGPGGWGLVVVRDGQAAEERKGFAPATTNNRMEFTAVIEALKLVQNGDFVTIFSDSRLVVQTLGSWAAAWEKRGWTRRDGEVKNLDLVKEAWGLLKDKPNVRVEWIEGHAGQRWNERADALATAYQREGEAV